MTIWTQQLVIIQIFIIPTVVAVISSRGARPWLFFFFLPAFLCFIFFSKIYRVITAARTANGLFTCFVIFMYYSRMNVMNPLLKKQDIWWTKESEELRLRDGGRKENNNNNDTLYTPITPAMKQIISNAFVSIPVDYKPVQITHDEADSFCQTWSL